MCRGVGAVGGDLGTARGGNGTLVGPLVGPRSVMGTEIPKVPCFHQLHASTLQRAVNNEGWSGGVQTCGQRAGFVPEAVCFLSPRRCRRWLCAFGWRFPCPGCAVGLPAAIPGAFLGRVAMARHGTAWHGLAWHNMAWHGMTWHGTTWCSTAWHGTEQHGMAQGGTGWHRVARHTTAHHGAPRRTTAHRGTPPHPTTPPGPGENHNPSPSHAPSPSSLFRLGPLAGIATGRVSAPRHPRGKPR